MSSNNNNYLITTTILIITTVYHLLNIIPIAFSIDEDTELDYKCLNLSDKNSTINYKRILESVLNDLITNTPLRGGYGNASYIWFQNPEEQAYGHALCRGDLSPDECQACVQNASNTLINTTHCPDSRSAIIWREHCMVKYSDVYFFGIVDTNFSSMYNTTGDTWDIFGAVEGLVSNNLIRIAINRSQNLYGTSSLITYYKMDTVTLYGFAQCTRDLVKANCTKCLDQAFNDLKAKDYWRYKGVRMLYGSCNLGYEIYPFLN